MKKGQRIGKSWLSGNEFKPPNHSVVSKGHNLTRKCLRFVMCKTKNESQPVTKGHEGRCYAQHRKAGSRSGSGSWGWGPWSRNKQISQDSSWSAGLSLHSRAWDHLTRSLPFLSFLVLCMSPTLGISWGKINPEKQFSYYEFYLQQKMLPFPIMLL